MKRLIIALGLMWGLGATAQAPVVLTTTEQIAIRAALQQKANIADERKKLDEADKLVDGTIAELKKDAAKSHPGYHLTTNPIGLVKD